MASILIAGIVLILLARHSKAGMIPLSDLHHRSNGPCQKLTVPVWATTNSATHDIPGAVREYISAHTIAQLGSTPSNSFKRPLLYILPEYDFHICQGDYEGIYDADMLKGIWNSAKSVNVHLRPNTGIALMLHNDATAGYGVVFDFLGENGF